MAASKTQAKPPQKAHTFLCLNIASTMAPKALAKAR